MDILLASVVVASNALSDYAEKLQAWQKADTAIGPAYVVRPDGRVNIDLSGHRFRVPGIRGWKVDGGNMRSTRMCWYRPPGENLQILVEVWTNSGLGRATIDKLGGPGLKGRPLRRQPFTLCGARTMLEFRREGSKASEQCVARFKDVTIHANIGGPEAQVTAALPLFRAFASKIVLER